MAGEIALGIYRHFKGNLYEVIGIARHSENPDEEYVVYRALYQHSKFGNNSLWIRPKTMFLETITRNGKTFPRFRYLGPNINSINQQNPKIS